MDHSSKYLAAILPVLVAVLVPEAGAQEYPSGHRALEVFDDAGRRAMPAWVLVWTVASTLWFAAGLAFVGREPIARWVVGGWAAALATLVALGALDSVLFRLAGFNALAHVLFWTPALYQLLATRPFLARPPTAFSVWSGGITAIMLFSYVFDIPYSITWIRHVVFEQ